MQYVIIARDGVDSEAQERRQRSRPDHLARAEQAKAAGEILFGGAILNEDGAMIGSVVVVDFPDEDALQRWLAEDPYVVGGVWETIETKPFRLAPL